MNTIPTHLLASLLLLVAPPIAGCESEPENASDPSATGGGTSSTTGGGGSAGTAGGPTPVGVVEGRLVPASGSRRLSRAEYGASVKSLLGEEAPVDFGLLPIDASAPFDNFAADQVASLALIEGVDRLADELGQWTVATPARLAAIVGCRAASATDEACYAAFIRDFGRRAFRRPLTDEERRSFDPYAEWARRDGDFAVAVRYAIAHFLSSPNFLYRIEDTAGPTGERRLDPFELATRLSFFLQGQAPDNELLDAAEQGRLSSADGRVSTVTRLLDAPRSTFHLQRLHAMWLGYSRLASDDLFGAMRRESDALVARASQPGRDYFELWTSPETWLEPTLAQHYGLTLTVPSSGAWIAAPDGRAGILGHGSFLTASSNTNDTSPTRRGKFVRERLLCSPVPPPPPGVDVDQPPGDAQAGACKEQRYIEHRTRAECAGCHSLMDPIGFGLERFDRLGAFRTHDDGREECSVSGAGEVAGAGTFNGPAELASLLAESDGFVPCLTRQFSGYALGIDLAASDLGAAFVAQASARFQREGHELRQLLQDIALSDALATRVEEVP